MSSNKKTEPVKVNPAGDKTFYEQGGGEGLSPNLFTKPSTWWKKTKKKPLYTFFQSVSLHSIRHQLFKPFPKKKKKKSQNGFHC